MDENQGLTHVELRAQSPTGSKDGDQMIVWLMPNASVVEGSIVTLAGQGNKKWLVNTVYGNTKAGDLVALGYKLNEIPRYTAQVV